MENFSFELEEGYNPFEDTLENNYDVNGSINSVLESYFSDILHLGGSNSIDSAKAEFDKVINHEKFASIPRENLLKVNVDKAGLLTITYKNASGTSDSLHFNLEAREGSEFFLGNQVERIKEQSEAQNAIIKRLENNSQLLEAMESIFMRNNEELLGYLGEKDILTTDKYGKGLEGKNMREIQLLFRDGLAGLQRLPVKFFSEAEIQNLRNQEEKYLEMIVGIGDYYEGGSAYLRETDRVYDSMIESIITNKEHSQLVSYLESLHKKVDENDWQSSVVEQNYREFFEKIHLKIVIKLIEKDAIDEDLIAFVEVVTGRREYMVDAFNPSSGRTYQQTLTNDIDDNLRSPGMANLALFHLAQRKGEGEGGFLEKIKNPPEDLFFSSHSVQNNPSQVLKDAKGIFLSVFSNENNTHNFNAGALNIGEYFLKNLEKTGYEDVFSIKEGTKYEDLTYSQKFKLNTLERVMKKVESGRSHLENTIKNSMDRGTFSSIGNYDYSYMLQEFSGLFNEVAEEYIGEVVSTIDTDLMGENYWFAKTAEDLDLMGEDAKVYELFADINGLGAMDFSDNSVEWVKFGGKLAGTIAVGILSPMLLVPRASMMVSGAVAGISGTAGAIPIFKKGYDSLDEATYDLITDFLVGGGTGGLGGKLFGGEAGDIIRAAKNNGIDLAFLGLIPEMNRNIIIQKMFSGDEYITELEEVIDQYRNDHIRTSIITGNDGAYKKFIDSNKLYSQHELYPHLIKEEEMKNMHKGGENRRWG